MADTLLQRIFARYADEALTKELAELRKALEHVTKNLLEALSLIECLQTEIHRLRLELDCDDSVTTPRTYDQKHKPSS